MRRFNGITWLIAVLGLCGVLTETAAQAQEIRQQGAGFGIARRAANRAAETAGRTDWPTLGDGGTPGIQVHVSFNARNADVTLVTSTDYAQTQLLSDAQIIARATGFPRADYLIYDNLKTNVVDMEFNKYLRPLSSGKSGAAFELPMTRLAEALSASRLPRPIVLYVSSDGADDVLLTSGSGANEKSRTVETAYFVGAEEVTAASNAAGPQILLFRSEISPLSYLIGFGMVGMLLFTMGTMARMPWRVASLRRKAAQKKAEAAADEVIPDPAEVQKHYNAQKPHWVVMLAISSPLFVGVAAVFLLRGHGIGHALTNAILLLPPALTHSPVSLPAYLMCGTVGVFGASAALCAFVEARRKKHDEQSGAASAPSPEEQDETEAFQKGFALPLLVMTSAVPLMFCVRFLPHSTRLTLGSSGLQLVIFGIMAAAFGAAFLVGLYQWRKRRTTLLPGDPWHDMVQEVARKAGDIRVRRVVLTRSSSPNASASIWNTVGLTSGLLKKMEPNEVRVIIAHEIAHLKNGHAKKTLAVGLVVFAAYTLAFWFVLVPLKTRIDPMAYALLSSPLPGILIGNLLVPLLVGRGRRMRELEADRLAAHITGDPELVIRTLRKLHTLSSQPHHLKPSDELLSSHPSLAHRIDALRQEEKIPTPP